MKTSIAISLFLSSVAAFSPQATFQPRHAVVARRSVTPLQSSNGGNSNPFKKALSDLDIQTVDVEEVKKEVKNEIKDIKNEVKKDVQEFKQNTVEIRDELVDDSMDVTETLKSGFQNAKKGEVGSRGEVYFVAQVALAAFIIYGGIPIIGDIGNFLLGPGLMATGAYFVFASVKDLGNSLSPWPVPVEDGSLVKGGIYSQMRHPMYAGVLASLAGFSMFTDSADRLILTAFLWYVLEGKITREEEELESTYSDYSSYKTEVPSKLLPLAINDAMPWSKKD